MPDFSFIAARCSDFVSIVVTVAQLGRSVALAPRARWGMARS
jgi:hypothetical protein